MERLSVIKVHVLVKCKYVYPYFTPIQAVQCFYCVLHPLSRVMRKQTFCICENKGAVQLRSNFAVTAKQRLVTRRHRKFPYLRHNGLKMTTFKFTPRNKHFAHAKTKSQFSFAVTAKQGRVTRIYRKFPYLRHFYDGLIR